MSSSISIIVSNLNNASDWVNSIVPPIQIILGTFGNLFNIIIFTRRSLRTNPCSTYFLASSFNNFFNIYVALLTRYLSTSWDLDPSTANTALCKLRTFFVYASICLVLWFTVLASIDRFLSSSDNARYRRLSSLPIARKVIVLTTIFIYLIHIHILIFYKSGRSGRTVSCSSFSSGYTIFFNFFFLIVSCLLPIILMSIFGILMIFNVRNIRNRVNRQMNEARNGRLRSSDRQMVIMLLFQVLITTLCSAPYAIINIYSSIFITILKYTNSTIGQAVYSLALNIFRLFYYMNPIIGFYIYTLFSSKFRAEMKRCIRCGLKSILTATGLIRCLPLKAQQTLLNENQMNDNNESLTLARKGNTVHPAQYLKTMHMTSVP